MSGAFEFGGKTMDAMPVIFGQPVQVTLIGGSVAQGASSSGTVTIGGADITLPVSIAQNVPVTFTQPVAMTLAGAMEVQPVTIKQGTVSIDGTLPVSLSGIIPVSIAQTLPVSMAGTLPVSMAGIIPVSINQTVPVSFAQPIEVTGATGGGGASIDEMHQNIHDGNVFGVNYYIGTLANAAKYSISVVAGTIPPHVSVTVGAAGNCTLAMLEGGAWTGTLAMIPQNHYRDGTNTSLATWKRGGTLTSGVNVFTRRIPLATGFQVSNNMRSEDEWILKAGGTTTFEIVNISGAANLYSVDVTYYEKAV